MRKLICFLQILLIINIAVAQSTFTNFQDTPDADSIFKAMEAGQLSVSDVFTELERQGTSVDANSILSKMIASRNTYGTALDTYFDKLKDVSTRGESFAEFIGLNKLQLGYPVNYNKDSKTLTNTGAKATLLISQFSSADEIFAVEDGWLINGDRLGGDIRKEGFRKFTTTKDGEETFIDCERSASGTCEGVYRDGKFYIKGENVVVIPQGDLEIVGNGQDYYVVLDPEVFTSEQGLPMPLLVHGGNTKLQGRTAEIIGEWDGIAKTANEFVEYQVECLKCDTVPVSRLDFGTNEVNRLHVMGESKTKVTMGTPEKGYKFYLLPIGDTMNKATTLATLLALASVGCSHEKYQPMNPGAQTAYNKSFTVDPNSSERVALLKEAAELDFTSGLPLAWLANLEYRNRNLDEAEDYAKQAIALDDSLVSTQYLLGNICEIRGEHDLAKQHWSKGLKLDSNEETRKKYTGKLLELEDAWLR